MVKSHCSDEQPTNEEKIFPPSQGIEHAPSTVLFIKFQSFNHYPEAFLT